ncbi:Tautomerase/MIF superfamily [Fusarium flagelliforme]|uniref:Tautomerase/MIF superfamily n=1 Tax=Fusarium flagelliforme TaxID=2675880 RepID=UPI001E8E2A78|nr:Tautomerase/MIF superfamily [Fusarium flagelliforme]KAH7182831.1 Tautomerase/MIF superfamily [Fusarium flagelliforme]
MHLSPVMTIPSVPINPPTQSPNSKPRPRPKQEPSSPMPAPRLVPGERRVKPRLSKPSLDPVLESDQRLSRDVGQIVSGDASKVTRKHSLPILSRRRDISDEVVSLKQTDEVGDRIRYSSVVLAEIKTNVIIEDEFTFISELSEYLSIRYNRPASCIMITLQHGICIQFGGSCDPSYTIKIEALTRDMQPAANKRNVALLQRHMEQALGIPAPRGYLRFVPVAEDCAGWKGNTVAGEIADAKERMQATTERRASVRAPRRRSSKAFRETRSKAPQPHGIPAIVSTEYLAAGSNVVQVQNEATTGSDKPKMVKRRKSFIQALFPRSSSRTADRET